MHLLVRIARPAGRTVVAMVLSGLMAGLFAQGGMAWALGFVMLVPWLLELDRCRSLFAALCSAWLMSAVFTASAFWWFGMAIGDYTGVGAPWGLAILLVAAPAFQPQFLLFALARHVVKQKHGRIAVALAAAAAWVGFEWVFPKVLGDTLGYGLYPSPTMRQLADLGGSAGLTFLLLLANEGLAMAWAGRAAGWHKTARALLLTALVPTGIAAYGHLALLVHPVPASEVLRVGMVQSNLVDYEQRREREGASAVVREILDTHFAMTYDAVERQQADVILWSETVYPTTFGNPKSEAGAEFDAAIQTIVDAAKVPFVFGTYDRDTQGEYNAAAFVFPETGLLGFYRKTRLFPLTEYVPQWLDGPTLRKWLPWTGSWVAGNGAKVFPLQLKGGREIPVMASICLDDVDPGLAIAGARLGAQAILTMSNDAWFTQYPQGAQLHQAVAAFRSIETRMPQFRVTSNGYSAIIDATGAVVAGSRMGERSLVVGELPAPVPPRTLMVLWGDWVGPVACAALAWLTLLTAASWWRNLPRKIQFAPTTMPTTPHVSVLPDKARWLAGLLRGAARLGLLGIGAAIVFGDTLRGNSLAQIRVFAGGFLAPEVAAWCVLLAYSARLTVENGMLVLVRGRQRMEIAINNISALRPWRLPLPGPGLSLHLNNDAHTRYQLAATYPLALAQMLEAAGAPPPSAEVPTRAERYAWVRYGSAIGRLDRAWVKFLLFPVLLALPAFHLHQNIAYGGGFGEFYTFGIKAYGITFAIWWATWSIGVILSAAALRTLIEMGTVMTLLVAPLQTASIRAHLERIGLAALYLGLPGWLAFNALS